MPRMVGGPLTDADYDKINKALQTLEAAHMETQTALQAGFDCAAEDQACAHFKQRLRQVKKAYFPERP